MIKMKKILQTIKGKTEAHYTHPINKGMALCGDDLSTGKISDLPDGHHVTCGRCSFIVRACLLADDPSHPQIDFEGWFYKNCVRNRKNDAKICRECPFVDFIEHQEAYRWSGDHHPLCSMDRRKNPKDCTQCQIFFEKYPVENGLPSNEIVEKYFPDVRIKEQDKNG